MVRALSLRRQVPRPPVTGSRCGANPPVDPRGRTWSSSCSSSRKGEVASPAVEAAGSRRGCPVNPRVCCCRSDRGHLRRGCFGGRRAPGVEGLGGLLCGWGLLECDDVAEGFEL